jgi:hypothetical protein
VRYTNSSSKTSLFTLALSLMAGAFVACAPGSAATTVTAADVPAAPASREAAAAPEALPGKLVCRTTSIQEGTTELFLDWNGTSAKGFLRHIAPSGNTTIKNVKAERYKGMIIADDTLNVDLVVHAATIAEYEGKPHMRLGDYKQSWAKCE